MALVPAYNPGFGPLPYDEEGHVLAAGEFAAVESTDATTKAHLASGALIKVGDPGEGTKVDPGARAALDAVAAAKAEQPKASEPAKNPDPAPAGDTGKATPKGEKASA